MSGLERILTRCKNINLLIDLRLDFYSAPSGNNLHVQSSRTVYEQQAVIERAERDGVYAMLTRIRYDFDKLWRKLTTNEQNFVDYYYWQGKRQIPGVSDMQVTLYRRRILQKIKPLLFAIQGEFAYYDAYQTEFEKMKEGFCREPKRHNSKFAAVTDSCFDELDKREAAGGSSNSDK